MTPAPIHYLKRGNPRLDALVLVIVTAADQRILDPDYRKNLVNYRDVTLKANSLKPAHAEVFHNVEVVRITLQDNPEHDHSLYRWIALHEAPDGQRYLKAARNDVHIWAMTATFLKYRGALLYHRLRYFTVPLRGDDSGPGAWNTGEVRS